MFGTSQFTQWYGLTQFGAKYSSLTGNSSEEITLPMTNRYSKWEGSCRWREPESSRRKGMMEGDSTSMDVTRDVGVWLEGLAEGVDTTQNSQLTCLLCAWWGMKPAERPPAECLANLMFTLTPNYPKLIAILPSVCVCLHVFSSQRGFCLVIYAPFHGSLCAHRLHHCLSRLRNVNWC